VATTVPGGVDGRSFLIGFLSLIRPDTKMLIELILGHVTRPVVLEADTHIMLVELFDFLGILTVDVEAEFQLYRVSVAPIVSGDIGEEVQAILSITTG